MDNTPGGVMARINVDDKWFAKDPRRKKFVKAVGDEDKADGLALRFWVLGQEAYVKGGLVNKKQFYMLPYAKDFLACELAEERDGGIYIKGSKRRLEWYRKMIAGASKGGSQKSTAKAQAAKRREEAKRQKKSEHEENQQDKHKPPQGQPTNHKPPQVSYSYSHSFSGSSSQSNSNSESDSFENTNSRSPEKPRRLSRRVANANPLGAIQEFAGNPVVEDLLSTVSHQVQGAWVKAYPDVDWVVCELLKANVWITTNPHKAPKQFARFMSNWLSRSFENYRKGLPSRRLTNSEVNANSLNEMYLKAQKEAQK